MTVPTLVGRRRRARLLLSLTTMLCSGLAAPALAESAHPALDANGVDLVDGSYNLRLPVASIGAGAAALSLVVQDSEYDNWSGVYAYQTSSGGGTSIIINLANGYDRFTNADGYAASRLGTGATLTINSNESFTYQTLDGTRIEFTNPAPNDSGGTSKLCDQYNSQYCFLLPDTIEGRSGMAAHYDWTVVRNCSAAQIPDGVYNCNEEWRLARVSNDAGYQIAWTYVNPIGQAGVRRATAVLSNGNAAGSSTVTYAYPAANVMTVTTPGGRTWRLTGTPGRLTGVRRPSASADTTTISYGTAVTSVTRDGVTTGYSRSVSGSTATTVITDALSHTTTVVADLTKQRITATTNALSQTTAFAYDSVGRAIETTFPEGNKVQYGYDARGNLISTTQVAKPGSGLASLVATAAFPASCTNAACNEPSTTTDAAGRVTNYGYDGATGLVTTVTLPAPATGATRPETRYSYTTSGGVALLTGVSTCRTGATPACVGTADETRTVIAYDANLQPASVTVQAGDASLTATTATVRDAIGNVVSVDGPLAGSVDTTTYRYGADREQLGVIGADPAGSGPRARAATREAYNSDGQPSLVEAGTVNGTSNSDWAAFASAQQVATSYDANARPVRRDVTAGGATYGVTQASYDAVGRIDCTVVRMNPAAFASLPGACSASTAGSAGPDRIMRVTQYDAVDRTTEVTGAYGTSVASAEKTSFTANGAVASVTDGENNRTSYAYDGFDRLYRTYMPVTTQGAATSSTTDYEELAYDAAGNVTSRRLRDGTSIAYSYDALDRLTYKARPNLQWWEVDLSYAYDNLGHPVSAVNVGPNKTLGFTWDALGRLTGQSDSWYGQGNIASQYDLAGRRTRQTWYDGLYVTYDYDATGSMTAIRQNGSALLASFGYDDLGRRISLTRGNGVTTNYAYDPAGRLNALSHDLNGTAGDVSIGLTYNAAGQIATRTGSNDLYAYPAYANTSAGYTADGLNRYSAAAGAAQGYDGRGNLTSVGGGMLGYTSENQLTGTPATGLGFAYDPLGRLFDDTQPVNVALAYDGDAAATELGGTTGALLRRYVYGPGTDEPLVWHEGTGTGDTRWLVSDERGSVIAVTNGSGDALSLDSYDEDGAPHATTPANQGRFGYTGQQWIPSLGLWYYKARMYAPTLPRFLQPDPIGYGDGLNLYGYVGGDPVNRVDPWGLKTKRNYSGTEVVVIGSGGGGGGSAGGGGGSLGSASGGGSAVDPGTGIVSAEDDSQAPQSDDPPGTVVVMANVSRTRKIIQSVGRILFSGFNYDLFNQAQAGGPAPLYNVTINEEHVRPHLSKFRHPADQVYRAIFAQIDPLRGHTAIDESWEVVLDNTTYRFHAFTFQNGDIRVGTIYVP